LLPEGLTFGVPVTLTFHYTEEDAEGTLSDFLEIAYQGSDRVWYSLTWVTVDEQAKTISASVKHFTRWSVASKLRIEPKMPAIPVIEKGSTYNLHLAGAKDTPPKEEAPPENPGDDYTYLPPLPKRKQIPFQATWYVNGVTNGNQNVGTISVADKIHVTYHAPEEVPANNPVLITAELTDFEAFSKVEGKVIKHNKVVLYKRIKIRPDEYNFTLEVTYDTDMACGFPGQQYKDGVTMDVQVKNENGNDTVILTNIVNQDATANPFQISRGGCTISCFTGGAGFINVTRGTGFVSSQSDELRIDLLNTNTTTQGSKIDCPNQPGQNPTFSGSDHGMPLGFMLSSTEDQIINLSGRKGLWAKLSPK
jgi:hypothetical protein